MTHVVRKKTSTSKLPSGTHSKSSSKRKRKNPVKRWWHNIPIIGRMFNGVKIGETQIPVQGGTVILQSENAKLLGELTKELASLLGNEKTTIAFAPTRGRQVSMNIVIPKGSENDEEAMMRRYFSQ